MRKCVKNSKRGDASTRPQKLKGVCSLECCQQLRYWDKDLGERDQVPSVVQRNRLTNLSGSFNRNHQNL